MRKGMFAISIWFALAMLHPYLWAQDAAPAATATQQAAQKSFQEKLFQEVIKAPLITPRNQDDIKADIESARQATSVIDKRIAAAQEGLNRASQLLQQQKGEMDAIKKKIDLAKKEKRETDKITLEAEKKKADLVQDFLEKYKSLADAGVDEARSEKDLAQARVAAHEAELELSQKREARDKAGDTEFGAASLASSNAQEKALRASKTATDKNKGVADKLNNIEIKRMELFQIRAKLVTGVR
jgi:hypothetical protein